MKRKRLSDTGEILKYKARLCANGSQQTYRVNYWDTYAPVVKWLSVRIMLTLTIIHNLHSRSLDFVLAYPQAEVDVDMYMDLPPCVSVPGYDRSVLIMKIERNWYGLCQAGYNWHEHLKTGLVQRQFKPANGDPCIFYKHGIVVLVFVDDCLIFSTKKVTTDLLVDSLHDEYYLTDEGDISKYLGIDVTASTSGNSFLLRQ